jgi:hypothetical protein
MWTVCPTINRSYDQSLSIIAWTANARLSNIAQVGRNPKSGHKINVSAGQTGVDGDGLCASREADEIQEKYSPQRANVTSHRVITLPLSVWALPRDKTCSRRRHQYS